MKIVQLTAFVAFINIFPLTLHASALASTKLLVAAPQQEEMNDKNCSQKCAQMDKRGSHCFMQRVGSPLGIVITCGNMQECCFKEDACWNCPAETTKLIATFSCLLPSEIVCTPLYVCCNSQMAKNCLFLD